MTKPYQSPADRIQSDLNYLNLLISESVNITSVIKQLFDENIHPNKCSIDHLNEIAAVLFLLKKHQKSASKKCEKIIARHCAWEQKRRLHPQSHKIKSMCFERDTYFVRVTTEDGFAFVTDIGDIQRRDLRVGDTISMNKEGGACVNLEKRQGDTVPFV